jgi:D-threo-aldose 1-dehydrogenase
VEGAALQFGLAHPAVASTIPGARGSSEAEDNVRMAAHPIPAVLWEDLKDQGLILESAPTPA